MNFRIRKGTHVSHFHDKCPRWPTENYYEQEKPLWWGNLCEECSKLADIDASKEKQPQSEPDPDPQSQNSESEPEFDFRVRKNRFGL